MIDGERVGIVIAMRKYIAGLKAPQRQQAVDRATIINILEGMEDFIEELQRMQWRNNELATGAKMGNYEPSTIKRWKKSNPKMNLYQLGDLYKGVRATVDETLQNMFIIDIDSPRYETDYIYLGNNRKIGIKEDGEPAFIGLSPTYAKMAQDEFRRRLQQLTKQQ